MALEIRQVQKLTQQLVMTPQLQQAIKLLQLSRVELEEMVVKELQENPALEEGPAEETEANAEAPRIEAPVSAVNDPAEMVLNREISAVDKIGTLDWQEYLDTHSNSIHGSLTAEATSDDGDGRWIAAYAGLSSRDTYTDGDVGRSHRTWFGSFHTDQRCTNEYRFAIAAATPSCPGT